MISAMRTNQQRAIDAGYAHANLVKWQVVITLLEANLASTSSHGAATKVIDIAKAERQKYQAQYNKHIGDIS